MVTSLGPPPPGAGTPTPDFFFLTPASAGLGGPSDRGSRGPSVLVLLLLLPAAPRLAGDRMAQQPGLGSPITPLSIPCSAQAHNSAHFTGGQTEVQGARHAQGASLPVSSSGTAPPGPQLPLRKQEASPHPMLPSRHL